LTIPAAEYLIISGIIPFLPPVNPPIQPNHPATATATANINTISKSSANIMIQTKLSATN
jgi:hypothetical protein